MDITNQTILTITQIVNQVKFTLESNYSNIWVQGEITSCKSYPSGYIYINLKDEHSELSAVIFSKYSNLISHKPKVGMNVTAIGDLSLYASKGHFQFRIKNLYPTGKGELWATYESLKTKLEAQGLFSIDKKKQIPRFPKEIGIITSSEGAAFQDIVNILNRRAPYAKCTLYPVPVQGKNAALKISEAIYLMNQYGKFDTIIIGRGGGSLEDIWCFNDEKVVRAIYESKIPLISGIGHDIDITLADYAVDCRAPTPSAAAELAAEDIYDIMQILTSHRERFNQSIHQNINKLLETIDSYQKRYGFIKPQLILEQRNKILDETNHYLKKSAMDYILKISKDFRLKKYKMKSLDPKSQLDRGFAIAMDTNQKIIFSSTQIDKDDVIKLQLADGVVNTKVL